MWLATKFEHSPILTQTCLATIKTPPRSSALPGTAADFHKPVRPGKSDQSQDIAAIYNEAGDEYAAYADGDPEHLFVFNGLHAYDDRYVWAVLDAKLSNLRASRASFVSLLDAGCSPGTWLRRLVIRARELGFTAIRARGFDFAEAQIDRARFQALWSRRPRGLQRFASASGVMRSICANASPYAWNIKSLVRLERASVLRPRLDRPSSVAAPIIRADVIGHFVVTDTIKAWGNPGPNDRLMALPWRYKPLIARGDVRKAQPCYFAKHAYEQSGHAWPV